MVEVFGRVMEGLEEALGHARGEAVPGLVLHVPAQLEVAEVRRRTGLSQEAFARTIGVSVGTLRNWEQKSRVPDGPARVLLAMLERDPGIVAATLGNAA